MADNTPLYNLKAVITEVGLSPATLRAWERRYGLLKPMRTPGGHRLYSRQDIEMLKWLVERQNEGLSISRAVELWNRLKTSEQNLTRERITTLPGETILDELRDQWLASCLAFDDETANHVLDQAFAISAPEIICTEILLKGMAQVGDRWYASSATVQQEHFTSAIATRRVNALLATATAPTRSGRILAACPHGEEHDFILLVFTYLLRRRGWDVVYLGADVPIEDLDTTIQSTAPELILSSAQTLNAAASLRRMAEFLITREVPLAYGGGVFIQVPGVTDSIPGNYLGDEVVSALQVVEQLFASPLAIPAVLALSPEYSQALKSYTQNEALMVRFISDAAQTKSIDPAHLEIAIVNFTRLIASALELGNINFLSQPIDWLNGLLCNRDIPVVMAREILLVFSLAVERYLGQDGLIIHEWLVKQIGSE